MTTYTLRMPQKCQILVLRFILISYRNVILCMLYHILQSQQEATHVILEPDQYIWTMYDAQDQS